MALEELQKQDLSFLLELWHDPEVMRYADEFPSLRQWSKASGVERAWKPYRKWRADLGPRYAQLILRLPDGTRIGESFVAPLPEGFRFGHWRKPHGVPTAMGDIKLDPPYWGERGWALKGCDRSFASCLGGQIASSSSFHPTFMAIQPPSGCTRRPGFCRGSKCGMSGIESWNSGRHDTRNSTELRS